MENFDFSSAKVRRDSRYSSRYVITDWAGYMLMKKRSRKATLTSPRFWTTAEKAQQALIKFQKEQEKKDHA